MEGVFQIELLYTLSNFMLVVFMILDQTKNIEYVMQESYVYYAFVTLENKSIKFNSLIFKEYSIHIYCTLFLNFSFVQKVSFYNASFGHLVRLVKTSDLLLDSFKTRSRSLLRGAGHFLDLLKILVYKRNWTE